MNDIEFNGTPEQLETALQHMFAQARGLSEKGVLTGAIDALRALRAERDALKAERDNAQIKSVAWEIAARRAEAERDAALAGAVTVKPFDREWPIQNPHPKMRCPIDDERVWVGPSEHLDAVETARATRILSALTPDPSRDERIARAAYELAAKATEHYPAQSKIRVGRYAKYDEQIEHSQERIRALPPSAAIERAEAGE
jgi:hypothetical protein